jgi:hypothetical protein
MTRAGTQMRCDREPGSARGLHTARRLCAQAMPFVVVRWRDSSVCLCSFAIPCPPLVSFPGPRRIPFLPSMCCAVLAQLREGHRPTHLHSGELCMDQESTHADSPHPVQQARNQVWTAVSLFPCPNRSSVRISAAQP